jgi:hypothetical protein
MSVVDSLLAPEKGYSKGKIIVPSMDGAFNWKLCDGWVD